LKKIGENDTVKVCDDDDDMISDSGFDSGSSPELNSDDPPMSRTHQYRKVMKPLLERKRRARYVNNFFGVWFLLLEHGLINICPNIVLTKKENTKNLSGKEY
jgi:hypothetical protein